MRLPSLKIILFTFFVFCIQCIHAQFKVPTKPDVLYPVYDVTGTLSESQKESLNQKLIKFNDSTSVQIEVVILPTTHDEDVNFAAWQIGEQWGIRNKDQKNGIVFLIAKDDRKMSIQQGRDAEQYITASTAGQILDYMVTPYFKQGDFYSGIDHGTSAIMDAVRGKFKPIKNEKSNDDSMDGFTLFIVVFVIILFLIIISKNNRGGGGYYNDDEDVIISRRGRRSYPGGFFPFPGSFGGGGFGGGSGGGFGGFGGGGSGGFGGGGASGGW
ncbi:MAG: TPM domain-containing protein [Bacteroidetes bacterium]|nr:TPM domain-containing protein [Bacteroidota bacterium]